MFDLRSFLTAVEGRPEHLVTVKKHVTPRFETCAVVQKLASQYRHPAVLFNKVEGSDFPVVTNIFADRERITLAFGATGEELNRIMREREFHPIEPKMVNEGPVQEIVWTGDQVDLTKLPIVTHNEKDGGPYITAGMTVLRDPDTGIRNVGIYRHMLQGRNKLGINLGEAAHGRLIFDKYRERGQPMPVAITIGHHPLAYLGSMSFVPFGIDEYAIMGGYMQEPLPLVKGKTVDMEVPAQGEIVLEGLIYPGVTAPDGPFGEYTTMYGQLRESPVIEVTAMTMRENPIYLDVMSGYADHMFLGGTPRLSSIYKAVRAACPTVKNVYSPPCGCCRFTCYISIKKRHEGEAKNALAAAFGADQFIRLAIAVDDDVDIFNDSAMLLAINTRLKPAGNVFTIPNAKTNALDPTAAQGLLVTKVGIDATKPLSGFPETVNVPGVAEVDLSTYL